MRTLLWFAVLTFASVVHALDAETFTLKNGLKVVVIEDHRAPVVINSVWYFAGSADEPVGKTGIAHMLEHMMFKGTPTVPAGDFSKIIARKGGQDNAFTSRDYTAYYQRIAKENLEVAMEMEADRMANLALTDAVFQPERNVVLEERRWRIENKPKSRFFEELLKKAMPNHPYGNPVIGWREDIENYTVDDAVNWYNSHYTPNNAVLILAGDVSVEEAKPLVEKYYGAVPVRMSAPFRETFYEMAQTEPIVLEKTDAAVQVPMWIRLYRAPSVFAGVAGEAETTKDAIALAVLADVLGGGDTSRLYQALVQKQKIANVAESYYSPIARAETWMEVYIEPKEKVEMSHIEAAVYEVVLVLQDVGITTEELDRARNKMLAADVFAQDSVFGTVYRVGRWLMAGGDVETFDDWQAQLRALTVEDVRQAAVRYLVPTQSTTGTLKH